MVLGHLAGGAQEGLPDGVGGITRPTLSSVVVVENITLGCRRL